MKKVLIVDDEPNIVMTLEYSLKKNNFEVYIARDGYEALDLIQKTIPDLIILDIMMPMLDGYETLTSIKNNDETKQIKTIFLTAKNKQIDMDKGFELGVDAYITKPFSIKKVIDQVKSLVEDLKI